MVSASTVYVVDDDAAVRTSLEFLLKSARFPVRVFASGLEFLQSYRPHQPGCVLLDCRMPEMDGMDVQEVAREQGVNIPIIMVTAHADVSMAVKALKRGAFDFIEKPYRDDELIAQIQRAIQADLEQRQNGPYLRNLRRRALLAQERLHQLTEQERKVLDMVVDGLSNREISEELSVTLKTVEAHRKSLMIKMKVDNLAELVRMVVESESAGLLPQDDASTLR